MRLCLCTSFIRLERRKKNVVVVIARSVVNDTMDYWTGIGNSPVYEFPYSGAHSTSLPFLNYNSNEYPTNYPHDPLLTPIHYGRNAVVYHIPGLS